MKVCLINAKGTGLTIPLPNAMLFRPLVLKLLTRSTEGVFIQASKIPPKTIDRIYAAIKAYKRTYGSWELVHIESAEGNIVIINI